MQRRGDNDNNIQCTSFDIFNIRSLAKKRRELAELEESNKQLKHQVKAKKQNISTLEDLLKETNRMRNMEVLSLKRNLDSKLETSSSTNPQTLLPDTIAKAPKTISFFVCGPDGLCVEFNESADLKVRQLISEARRLFLSNSAHAREGDVQLVLRGKVLVADQILRDCDIRSGDTLVLLLPPVPAKIERSPDTAAPMRPESKEKEQTVTELLQLLSQQQKNMQEFAHDVK